MIFKQKVSVSVKNRGKIYYVTNLIEKCKKNLKFFSKNTCVFQVNILKYIESGAKCIEVYQNGLKFNRF